MKNWLDAIVATVLTIFAPIEATCVVVFVLAIIDMITGVLAARKEGQKITSARLRDTVTKIFVYEVALLTAVLLEKYIIVSLLPAVKVVAAIIGVAEGKSIMENLDSLYGQPLFKSIIDKLGSINK